MLEKLRKNKWDVYVSLPLKGLKTVFQGMTSGIVLFTIINRCIYVHRRIFNCNGMSASDSQIYRFKSIALNNCANKLPVTYLYRCLTWVRRRKYDTLKRGSRWHARIAEVVYPQTYTHIYILETSGSLIKNSVPVCFSLKLHRLANASERSYERVLVKCFPNFTYVSAPLPCSQRKLKMR